MNNYSAERTNANVLTLRFPEFTAGFEQWFLLSSDRHHDSIYCDRKNEKKHLDEALTKEAIILDAGDAYDLMQGKHDPRKNYDELRPEYKQGKYYDVVIDDCIDFYEKGLKQIEGPLWNLMADKNLFIYKFKSLYPELYAQIYGQLRLRI